MKRYPVSVNRTTWFHSFGFGRMEAEEGFNHSIPLFSQSTWASGCNSAFHCLLDFSPSKQGCNTSPDPQAESKSGPELRAEPWLSPEPKSEPSSGADTELRPEASASEELNQSSNICNTVRGAETTVTLNNRRTKAKHKQHRWSNQSNCFYASFWHKGVSVFVCF